MGGMKDVSKMVTYSTKKESLTLHEVMKRQAKIDAENSKFGCQCSLS